MKIMNKNLISFLIVLVVLGVFALLCYSERYVECALNYRRKHTDLLNWRLTNATATFRQAKSGNYFGECKDFLNGLHLSGLCFIPVWQDSLWILAMCALPPSLGSVESITSPR